MLIKPSIKELVSVVLPVYNAEDYITASVESVLKQTYKNFEIIIINDGSTDGTQSQLDRFRKARNIKIIERENKGLVRTLNEAINFCEGRFIMRMDADDICFEHRMEKQLSLLKSNKLDIVGSNIKVFGGLYNYTRKYFSEDAKLKFQLLFTTCFAHPAILCKKEVLHNNLYDSAYEKIEDYELWTRLASQSYQMGNCGEVLLAYRVHKKQITTESRTYQDRKRVEIAKNYCCQYFSTEAYVKPLELLLGRDFKKLDKEAIEYINKFYDYLISDFKEYADIINYQFFLCLLHNHFANKNITSLKELSFFRKNLIMAFNKGTFLKKVPVQAFRKLS